MTIGNRPGVEDRRTCEAVQQVLSEQLDRDAGHDWGPRSDRLEAHVAACVECQSFRATATTIRRRLRLDDAATTVDVRSRVLESIDMEPTRQRRFDPTDGPVANVDARPEDRFGRRWAAWLATAAVVAAAIGVAVVAPKRSATPIRSEAAEAQPPPSIGSPPAPSMVEAALADLAVVWTADRLDPTLSEGLAQLPMVERATVVRRGTVGMTGTRPRARSRVGDVPGGWAVPTDVIAVDVAAYGALFETFRSAGLVDGSAVLGRSTADRMGLGQGASLDFERGSVRVAAVVDDAVIGGAEVAVGRRTGELLGVIDPRYAVVRSTASTDELVNGVRTLTDLPFRVRTGTELSTLRNNDAVLTMVEVKDLLGEYAYDLAREELTVDATWYDTNVVTVPIEPLGTITCHRVLVEALIEVMDELRSAGQIDVLDVDHFEGCYNPRFIRGTGEPSRHSWGGAVDFGTADETPDPALITAMMNRGFVWGGDWLIPDGGHFEFVGAKADGVRR